MISASSTLPNLRNSIILMSKSSTVHHFWWLHPPKPKEFNHSDVKVVNCTALPNAPEVLQRHVFEYKMVTFGASAPEVLQRHVFDYKMNTFGASALEVLQRHVFDFKMDIFGIRSTRAAFRASSLRGHTLKS